MSICASCGDTRISYTCEIAGEGVGRHAYWPACPDCAGMPRREHMALVYGHRKRIKGYDVDHCWLSLFRPDEQAEILKRAGPGRQLRLFD